MKKKEEVKIDPSPNDLSNIAASPKKYERMKQLIKDHPLPDIPSLEDR